MRDVRPENGSHEEQRTSMNVAMDMLNGKQGFGLLESAEVLGPRQRLEDG